MSGVEVLGGEHMNKVHTELSVTCHTLPALTIIDLAI